MLKFLCRHDHEKNCHLGLRPDYAQTSKLSYTDHQESVMERLFFVWVIDDDADQSVRICVFLVRIQQNMFFLITLHNDIQ